MNLPPTVSDAEMKRQILEGLAMESNTMVEENIDIWWRYYFPDSGGDPRLTYFYVYRHAAQWLMGRNWGKFDWEKAGVKQQGQDMVENLKMLVDNLTTRIEEFQKLEAATRGPVTGPITATAPIMPDFSLQPDPNARVYRGDPLRRPFKVIP